jgi:hypothetical protein
MTDANTYTIGGITIEPQLSCISDGAKALFSVVHMRSNVSSSIYDDGLLRANKFYFSHSLLEIVLVYHIYFSHLSKVDTFSLHFIYDQHLSSSASAW